MRSNLKTIRDILDAVARNFEEYDNNIYVTDVGTWEIELINTEGRMITVDGALISNSFSELSNYIRERIGRNDLFMFDGNPDRVESDRSLSRQAYRNSNRKAE
jgi:hypothetical protein